MYTFLFQQINIIFFLFHDQLCVHRIWKSLVVSVLAQVFGGHQLTLVPLAVQVAEDFASVLHGQSFYVDDALLALLVNSDMQDLRLFAPYIK